MPAAIPAVVSIAASYAASSAIATYVGSTILGSTLLAAAVSKGVGFIASQAVSGLISPKAKAAKSGNSTSPQYPYVDNGVKTTTRNSIEFRDYVYGETRKAGTLLFEKTTSSGYNNKGEIKTGRDAYLHQIIAAAGHEIQQFEEFYLDDDLLTIDSSGWVTNAKYTKNSDTEPAKGAVLFVSTGYPAENATGSGTSASIYINTAYATATSYMGAGDLIQVAGLADNAYNGQFIITSIASHAAGLGTRVNYTTDTTITTASLSQTGMSFGIGAIGFRGTTAYCYNNSGHGLIASDKVFISEASPDVFNNDETTVLAAPTTRTFTYQLSEVPIYSSVSGTFQRRNGTNEALVYIKSFLGTDAQNLGLDIDINDKMPDVLLSTDRFAGIACVYIRLYDSSSFTSSPNLTFKIKGAKVYDPRTGSLAYSDNAILCQMDYLHRKIGENKNVPIGIGLNYDTVNNISSDLDLDFISDQADIADEEVATLSSTQTQFNIAGTVSLGEQPIDILSLMIPCTQGAITYYDFLVKLHCAAYEPVQHSVDETWLNGAIEVQVEGDKQNLVNTVKTLFNDEDQKYYADDMPKYQDATALAEDNDEVLTEDLQMPFITNIERAQRLGKLYLKQNRASRRNYTVSLNPKGCVIAPFDTISLTYERWGFSNKIFKVIGYSEGLLNEGVNVILREEDPSIYDWDASEASI